MRNRLQQRLHEFNVKSNEWATKNRLLLILAAFIIYPRLILASLNKEFWHDEAFQYLYSLKPVLFILNANDVHPPLYTLYTKILVTILGPNIFMLRLLGSVVFSVFFILILFEVIKGLFDEKTAFWAAMLIAIAPTYLYYSFEFRNYAFTLWLVIIQIYFFNKMVEFPAFTDVAGYLGFSLLSLYSHFLTGLIILVQVIYIGLLYHKGDLLKTDIKYYVRIYLAMAALCIPLLWYLLTMAGRVDAFWFQNINLVSFISTFAYLVTPPLLVPVGLSTFLFGLIIWGLIRYRKDFNLMVLQFLLYLVVPVIVMFIFSQVIPFYHHRYFLFGGIGAFVIAGWILAKIGHNNEQYDQCFYGFYVLLVVFAFLHGFTASFSSHEIYDAARFLDNYSSNLSAPFVTVHSSQFSQSPFKVYFPNNKAYLITNFTERQRFTAGGSVIDKTEVYHNISDVPITRYMFWVSDRKLPGQTVLYSRGGLYVQSVY